MTDQVRPLTAREFEQIRRLAREQFGLSLRDGQETLVSSRLGKMIRELGFHSFQEYCSYVLEDSSGQGLIALIDALTTNHTSFFREQAHFDFLLQTILPGLRGRSRISIWSAACSTGEEPYSISFSLFEELGENAFGKLRILATDISTRVLEAAGQGVYPAARFDGISPHRLRQFLLRGHGRFENWYRVKPVLRAAIEFRRLNLMQSFSHLGPFPLIFCRNVMIYFDKPVQQDLVNRLAGCLEPGGYLFIGHSESLNGLAQPLDFVRPAIYRKPESKPPAALGGQLRT